MGTPVFSASCASVTGPEGRLTPPSADRRWSRKDGEAARQGRAPHKTSQCVPILGTQAATPFTAKGQSQAAVTFAGAGGPGHRAGKSACAATGRCGPAPAFVDRHAHARLGHRRPSSRPWQGLSWLRLHQDKSLPFLFLFLFLFF